MVPTAIMTMLLNTTTIAIPAGRCDGPPLLVLTWKSGVSDRAITLIRLATVTYLSVTFRIQYCCTVDVEGLHFVT